jgi:hypothetical protein
MDASNGTNNFSSVVVNDLLPSGYTYEVTALALVPIIIQLEYGRLVI